MILQIRRMKAEDLPGVLAIQAEAYAGAVFEPESVEVYRNRMRLAPGLCFVAVVDSAVVGYLVSHGWHDAEPPQLDTVFDKLPESTLPTSIWYLHDCAVSATARGVGAAKALFDEALSAAQALGLRSGALVAVPPAEGYWQRLGYVMVPRPALAAKLAAYGNGAQYMQRVL